MIWWIRILLLPLFLTSFAEGNLLSEWMRHLTYDDGDQGTAVMGTSAQLAAKKS